MASGLALLGTAAGVLIVGGLVVYLVVIYNGLVRLKKNIEKAMGNIDVLLKQRNDEIPKLVDTAQEYMDYEKDVLQQITEARTQVEGASNPKEKANADQMMKSALGTFFAVAEDYPDLKAQDSFQQLQNRISQIEDSIADRREFYNASVTTYNTRINQIPYNIVANQMGYTDKEVFEATEEEKADVNISDQFNN